MLRLIPLIPLSRPNPSPFAASTVKFFQKLEKYPCVAASLREAFGWLTTLHCCSRPNNSPRRFESHWTSHILTAGWGAGSKATILPIAQYSMHSTISLPPGNHLAGEAGPREGQSGPASFNGCPSLQILTDARRLFESYMRSSAMNGEMVIRL